MDPLRSIWLVIEFSAPSSLFPAINRKAIFNSGCKKETNMENREAYEGAKKRVEAKIGFYVHLAVYLGVNVLLIVINLTTSPRSLWFIWPLFGWGIGLLFHGMSIFVFSGRKFREAKERMIEEEIKKVSR